MITILMVPLVAGRHDADPTFTSKAFSECEQSDA